MARTRSSRTTMLSSILTFLLPLSCARLIDPESSQFIAPAVRAQASESPTTASTLSKFRLTSFVPGPTTWKESLIVKNGTFCPDAVGGQSDSSCLQPNEHMDRTSFKFLYGSERNDSKVSQPEVFTNNKQILKPKVLQFVKNPAEGTGSFIVLYGCVMNGTALVTLKMRVTKSRSVSFSWKKICGGGKNDLVSMIPIGLLESNNPRAQGLKEAGPTESKTVVEFQSKYPQTAIDFQAPRIFSDSNKVLAKLRGHVQSGTVTTDPKKFVVTYDCSAGVLAKITLSVAIPPWNNETLQWVKDCGGSKPNLVIQTAENTVFGPNGVSQPFRVTEKTTVGMAQKNSIIKLGPDASLMKFELRNLGDTDMVLNGLATTVTSPTVLAVSAEGSRGLFADSVLVEDGHILVRPKSSVKLNLRCICLARGSSVVLVTLPVLHYETVEFGFYKTCKKPHVFHHSSFLRTAPSLTALVVVGVAIAGCVIHRIRRSRDVKYSRVDMGSG